MRIAKNRDSDISTTSVEIQLEKDVWEKVLTMEKYAKIPKEEIVNTALKRYISAHKDYFPDKES